LANGTSGSPSEPWGHHRRPRGTVKGCPLHVVAGLRWSLW